MNPPLLITGTFGSDEDLIHTIGRECLNPSGSQSPQVGLAGQTRTFWGAITDQEDPIITLPPWACNDTRVFPDHIRALIELGLVVRTVTGSGDKVVTMDWWQDDHQDRYPTVAAIQQESELIPRVIIGLQTIREEPEIRGCRLRLHRFGPWKQDALIVVNRLSPQLDERAIPSVTLTGEQGDEAEIGGMIEMLNVIGGSFFLRDKRTDQFSLFLFRKMEIEES